jgi:hypothetical protein
MPFDATPLPWQAKVLVDALTYMRTNGWCPAPRDDRGGVCIYNAIRAVGYHRNIEDLGIPWPAAWNDEPGRTWEEVEQWMLDRISEALTGVK